MNVLAGALVGLLLALLAMFGSLYLTRLDLAWPGPRIAAGVGIGLGALAGWRSDSAWPALAWWLAMSLPFAVTAVTDATAEVVYAGALAPLVALSPLVRALGGGWGEAWPVLAAGAVFFLAAQLVATVAGILSGPLMSAPIGGGDILTVAAVGVTFGFGDGLRVLFAGMLFGAAVAAVMLRRGRRPEETMAYASCLCMAALVAIALTPPG